MIEYRQELPRNSIFRQKFLLAELMDGSDATGRGISASTGKRVGYRC